MSWFEDKKQLQVTKKLLVLVGHRLIKNTAAWFGELSFPGRWLPTMVLGLELPHRFGWDGIGIGSSPPVVF